MNIEIRTVVSVPGDALGEGGDSDAIVGVVPELCKTLGISTTTEGVETAAQLNALRMRNCSHVQGYPLSRPSPAEQVAAMCASVDGQRVAVA